jgi:AcrR family transcriptional regulator
MKLKYDDRLDHLLRNAASVFATKGYHSTTMRDLSRETGMSLSGMYYYVEGKDELLFTIQDRCFSAVISGARSAVELALTPEERLQLFIRHHVTFFAHHMAEMKVLSHEAESLSKVRRTRVDTLKREYVEMLLEIVRNVRTGANNINPHVAAYALFGMMNWIYTWYDPEGPETPDALANQLAQLFVYGITPIPVTHGG